MSKGIRCPSMSDRRFSLGYHRGKLKRPLHHIWVKKHAVEYNNNWKWYVSVGSRNEKVEDEIRRADGRENTWWEDGNIHNIINQLK